MIRFYRVLYILFVFISILTVKVNAEEIDADNKYAIKGVVLDAADKDPIPFAVVYVYDLNLDVQADANGEFTFNTSFRGTMKFRASCVGYESTETEADPSKNIHIFLSQSNYSLNEIIVSAKEGVKGNSVSLIEKSSMQHIQPSSFADLLQLLPGYSSENISMNESQHIKIRQAGSDMNTSLGTAFVIDGITMNNDASLQRPYNLSSFSDANKVESRTTTNRGVDMRLISTDMIESVEIIRGIASAKYGDLTSGVVKIELKNGYTPWEARVKTDLNNTLLSVGKGFILPNQKGVVNFDVDYAMYNPEPRTDLTKYSRASFALRHENQFKLAEGSSFLYKVNVAYTGSFDKDKTDPDALSKDDYLKNNYNRYAISTQGKFTFNNKFIQNLNYSLSYTHITEKLEQLALKSLGGTRPLTTISKEEGEFNTGYLPAEYNSFLQILGEPINLSARLDAKSSFSLLGSNHSLSYGSDFSYNKNRGKGEIYDPNYPPFDATVSSRPRPFVNIPSLQRLGFYLEDNINLAVGKTKVNLQPSVRTTSMLNLGEEYEMQGKFYWEPRFNTKITFPQFSIFGQNSSFSLFGGAGIFYKFPTLSQLHPDNLYFDYVQLNYYSQTPEYRFANVKTYIENPTNYSLAPAKNFKYEVGFTLAVENVKLDVTFFKEKMNNGFYSVNNYTKHSYRDYNAGSVVNPTEKPSLTDFTYTDEIRGTTYRQHQNIAKVDKMGIEYTLDFGKIDAIYTHIWINGAWFKTHYDFNAEQFVKIPTAIIKDKPYPYIGVYDHNGTEAKEQTQFNTNLNFDTHIPFLKMIFSTKIETMWFTTRQSDYNSGMPIGYFDVHDNWYDFAPNMANDGTLLHLVTQYNDYTFSKDRVAIAANLNLKLSKEIGKYLRLSCFANNLLSYLPNYTNVRGLKVSREKDPYFGAEINIKF